MSDAGQAASGGEPGGLRTWLIRLALLVPVLAVAFGTAELATRLFLPPHLWQFRDATDDWQIDPLLGWVQKPDLDVRTRAGPVGIVHFQTNSDGLTPATARREPRPGVLRILLFGDSSIVGRAVAPDQTPHAQLERRLSQAGIRAEVLNAGVQGYSTDQALLQMERLLPLYRPDVVAYCLHPNDFGGIVSRVAYGVGKPVLVPGPGGELQVLPPEPEALRIRRFGSGPRKWIQSSAFYRLLQPTLYAIRAVFADWEEKVLLGTSYASLYHDKAELERIDWGLFAALLVRMREASERHGARFFFYAHPGVAEVWEPFIRSVRSQWDLSEEQYDRHALEKRLTRVARERGIPFCPMIDPFLRNAARGPFHILPTDYHCNASGHELTAEVLLECLAQQGLVSATRTAAAPGAG